MQTTPQVTFKNMASSEALSNRVNEEAARLERFHDRITGCRVLIERPHRHRTHGQGIHVRIDLSVPGAEIVVGKDLIDGDGHQNAYVAVSEAFHVVRRRLQGYSRRLQRRGRGVTSVRRRPTTTLPSVG